MGNVNAVVGGSYVNLQNLAFFNQKGILIKAEIKARGTVFFVRAKLLAQRGYVVPEYVGAFFVFKA